MQELYEATPYDAAPAVPPWNETTMPINIGGDARRSICLYNNAGVGICDGTYLVWAKKGSNPWVRVGAPIVVAGSSVGHAIVSMETINTFDKLYVSIVAGAAADRWFLASGGNQGYE